MIGKPVEIASNDEQSIAFQYDGKQGVIIGYDNDKEFPIMVRFARGAMPMRECRFSMAEVCSIAERRKAHRRVDEDRRG
jgi:hypothetical protein